MLYPGEVSVALWRDAELTPLPGGALRVNHRLLLLRWCSAPAHVVVLAEPVVVVERRVGEDVVGERVGKKVAAEGLSVFVGEVDFDFTQRAVDHRETSGGRFPGTQHFLMDSRHDQ